jgi:transcriptional regulator with XRE-family HTH domain
MTSKALAPEQGQVAREIVKRLLRERFDGNREELAKRMGIKLPTLSDIINGHKGVGSKSFSGLLRILPTAAAAITSGKMELVDQAFAASGAPSRTVEPDVDQLATPELDVDEEAAEDARGRALLELIKDGFDPRTASGAIDQIAFDHSVRPVDWRDYYFKAKEMIRKASHPSKTVGERSARPGELGVIRQDSVADDLQAIAGKVADKKAEDGREDPSSSSKIKRAH